MTNPLTDEVIDKAVEVFQIAEIEYGDKMQAKGILFSPELSVEYAMRAAAKVIESALAVDRRDAERYQYIRDSGSEFVRYKGGGTHGLLEDEKLDSAVDLAIEKLQAAIKGKSHE